MSERKLTDFSPDGVLRYIRESVNDNVARLTFAEKWDAEKRARAKAAQDVILAALTPPTVIEHDPSAGCWLCPFRQPGEASAYDCCMAAGGVHPSGGWRYAEGLGVQLDGAERPDEYPAPDWCPLRTADVLVRRKR